MDRPVRTRFAPSPTGYLHIGGARTALFNYLLARHTGGTFVLRIEDTDQSRNVAEADQKLLDDLRWLGLDWDEGPEVGGDFGPYYQSQRLDLYGEHVRRLLEEGLAYYAMETPEELEAMRAAALKTHGGFRYRRRENYPSESDAEKARSEGRPVVVRFKMPERDFVIRDQILGDVTVGANELSDFVIQKADGWPTYHFAVVIDDALMEITHVLRGQEHLLNSANHIALQEAFGFAVPAYAHLPIILNMDGSKMGKREKDKVVRGAVREALGEGRLGDVEALTLSGLPDQEAFKQWQKKKITLENEGLQSFARELGLSLPEIQIHDFRVSGYLPEVLTNFIALLGWSPGEDREKMTREELCERFSVERIGRTNARFDRDKLLSFNTDAMSEFPMERKLEGFRDYLRVNEPNPLTHLPDALLVRLMEINKGFRLYGEIVMKASSIFEDDEGYSFEAGAVKKAFEKGDGAGLGVLAALRPVLEGVERWDAASLDGVLRSFAEERELKLGNVAQPLRVAVTGTMISPSLFETLDLLGKERSLKRIDRALRTFAPGS